MTKETETPASTSDFLHLETSPSVMKILSESIPMSHSQEVLGSKPNTSLPSTVPATSDTYATLTSVVTDNYDKQELNTIFDSLLQKWPDTVAFSDPSVEALPYSNPFPEHQSSPVYSGSYTGSPPESFRNEFQFSLGAPMASPYKSSEVPMVYLNKGQFYPITLHGVDSSVCLNVSKVKTMVMAVFENDKTPEMQLRFWNHWHSRQPTVKQRVIDIADYKEVYSGISNIEEVAFNALSFFWNPTEEAKVYIGINSLSTDFSSQKGVKGLPLNLQIDTYDVSSGTNHLIHRAACQVKIFCDKATPMDDTDRSVLKRLYQDRDQSSSPPSKQARREDPQRVLLYVRSGSEEVYDALMLSTPTLSGFREAVSEKYGIHKDTIGKIYKRCKRGILVNMDDNIIEHYTNQTAFQIEISEPVVGQFQVILAEV
ncbi:unnamed protein product, partial [Tetraodon nigroviridis]